MTLEDKKREAHTKGSLLHELVNDVLNLNSNPSTVVELGERDGSNIALLEDFGITISKAFVIDTNPICKYHKYHYITLDLNKEKLCFKDQSVDLILLVEVIEHLVNPDFCLSEVGRVLSPEGVAIITTPNLAWWPNIFHLLLGYQPIFTEVSTQRVYGRIGKEIMGHVRVFTYRSLREMLVDYGFEIIKYKTVQTSIVPRFLKPIDSIISKLIPWLGCDIYAVVRK